jgi:hypothetical protein
MKMNEGAFHLMRHSLAVKCSMSNKQCAMFKEKGSVFYFL